MSRHRSRIHIFLITVLALLLCWIALAWWHFISRPLLPHNHKAVALKIKPGSTALRIGYQLHDELGLAYPRFWSWFVKFHGDAHRLRAGEYQISQHMRPIDLLQDIVAGRVMVHRVRFIEGWTFAQMKQVLLAQKDLTPDIRNLSNQQIMHRLGSKFTHPEGLFFPDTYRYRWGETDMTVLKKAYAKMQALLSTAWKAREKKLWYRRPYQALIVASMIEKETALDRERPEIAGVILRRLKRWMHLQIDPTVVYGLHKPYGYQLTYADLRHKTPYNTYTKYGLPPTPICLPSRASILAALHPAKGKALYYVAKGDGSHVFSDTYREQRRAVRRYILHKPPEIRYPKRHDKTR